MFDKATCFHHLLHEYRCYAVYCAYVRNFSADLMEYDGEIQARSVNRSFHRTETGEMHPHSSRTALHLVRKCIRRDI